MRKLSKAQEWAVGLFPDDKWRSGYDTGCSRATLDSLARKGLLEVRHDLGSGFMPRSNIVYRKKP